MSPFVLFSILMVGSTNALKTAIGSKLSVQRNKDPIYTCPSTFPQLVQRSSKFVDKSLLIKELLEDPNRVVCITRPYYWGKTINMNMLKTFFEVTLDAQGDIVPLDRFHAVYLLFAEGKVLMPPGYEQYRLIAALKKPLLISNHTSIIDNHLCKHPVIHLDFSKIYGDSYPAFLDNLRTYIITGFKTHQYLADAFNITRRNGEGSRKEFAEKKLFWFNDMISKDRVFSYSSIRGSIKRLSGLLHQHFGTPTFVLIDGYDAPFTFILAQNFAKADKQEFLNFYATFLTTSFQNNTHLQKGILTGTFPTSKEDHNSSLSFIKHYNFLSTELLDFYGFHEHEVKQLLQEISFSKTTDDLSCYYQFQENRLRIYSPSFIAYSLSKRNRRLFNINHLKNFVSFFLAANESKFQNPLVNLINTAGSASVKILDDGHFTWNELELFHKVMLTKYDSVDEIKRFLANIQVDIVVDKMLLFLYTIGYLTLNKCESLVTDGYVCMSFSDKEMPHNLADLVRLYVK